MDPAVEADLDDPRPRYQRVADDLRQAIARGDYAVGQQLPSNREMSERFGISHMTVKQALGVLRNEGVITSHQGVGSFVRDIEAARANPRGQAFTELQARVEALEDRVQRLENHGSKSTVRRVAKP